MKTLKVGFCAIAFIIIATLISGCVATGHAFTEFAKPSGEQALLYIYRPFGRVARGGGPEMLLDGRALGTLLDSGYAAEYLAPGKHRVTAKGNIWNWAFPDLNFEIDVLPGSTTYILFTPAVASAAPGYIRFTEVFSVIDSSIARSEITNCRRIN